MSPLDPIDRLALERLMADGRLSWAELGAALGLSAPAAAERVRRLRTEGVIDGFTARVRPERVGLVLTVLVAARLERHEERDAFLGFVAECPEIVECHHVTGEDDYVLKVRTSGVPRLEALLGSEMKSAVRGLRTRTTLVLSTVKDSPSLPLAPPEAAVRAERPRSRAGDAPGAPANATAPTRRKRR